MRRHPDRLDGQQAMNRTNNERNLGMKQTINRISNRIADRSTRLFAIAALLLVPHAIIRPIIGIGLHHWIPIQWLALHVLLIILTLCTALAGCGSASKTSTPAHVIAATGTTCSEESSDERIKECIVTLSETRRVDCVITAGSQGVSGISCDWDHVSGAD